MTGLQKSEITEKLEQLSIGAGVRRDDLFNDLGDRLRNLWGIHSPTDPVFEMVQWHLEWLIAQIEPKRSTRGLERAATVAQFQREARVTFNISIVEIADCNSVIARRAWFEKQGGRAQSTVQRDMTFIVSQFAAILESGRPLPEREFVLAELDRRKRVEDRTAHYVRREEYEAGIQSAVSDGHMIVGIWGEAGTGKTVLAEMVALILGGGSVIRLRAADNRILQDDIVEALVAKGEEPSEWNESSCRRTLRKKFEEQDRSCAVIVDDIENEQELWQLVPKEPKVPIIITSRAELRDRAILTVELHDFTVDQARQLIEKLQGSVPEIDARSLSVLLGCRPLALDHALLFLRESRGVTIGELVKALGDSSVATGIDLITLPRDRAKNLARLYEVILESVLGDMGARRVLDAFLALSGRMGRVGRELLYFFLQSESGGSVSRVQFSSGVRQLRDYGLVRDSGSWWMAMHPLTHEILRELRGPLLYEIEQRYIDFLVGPEVVEFGGDYEDGRYWAWMHKRELTAMHRVFGGWVYLYNLDRSTWGAIRCEDADAERTHMVRYDVLPSAVYKIDYRTGGRAIVDLEEGRQLYRAVNLYGEAVKSVLFPDLSIGALPPNQEFSHERLFIANELDPHARPLFYEDDLHAVTGLIDSFQKESRQSYAPRESFERGTLRFDRGEFVYAANDYEEAYRGSVALGELRGPYTCGEVCRCGRRAAESWLRAGLYHLADGMRRRTLAFILEYVDRGEFPWTSEIAPNVALFKLINDEPRTEGREVSVGAMPKDLRGLAGLVGEVIGRAVNTVYGPTIEYHQIMVAARFGLDSPESLAERLVALRQKLHEHGWEFGEARCTLAAIKVRMLRPESVSGDPLLREYMGRMLLSLAGQFQSVYGQRYWRVQSLLTSYVLRQRMYGSRRGTTDVELVELLGELQAANRVDLAKHALAARDGTFDPMFLVWEE